MKKFVESGNLTGISAAPDLNQYSEKDLRSVWATFINVYGPEYEKYLSEILIKDKQRVDETRKKWAYGVILNLYTWENHPDLIDSILKLKDKNGNKLVDINNIDEKSTTFLAFLMYQNNREFVKKICERIGKKIGGEGAKELIKRAVDSECNLNQQIPSLKSISKS